MLINDISSSFLSEPMNVSDYGMLFGGVQKNLALAGLVIAIIRKKLISETILSVTPTMLRYKTHAGKKSLYNTPPTYNIYIVGKVIKWIQFLGGLEKMKEINEKKAEILYDYLDSSSLFYGLAEKDSRYVAYTNVWIIIRRWYTGRRNGKKVCAAGALDIDSERKTTDNAPT